MKKRFILGASLCFSTLIISIKRFLKRNLPHVGMAQCMNALADKQKVHAHMQIYIP